MRIRWQTAAVATILFLLPWQTAWVFSPVANAGNPAFGVNALYATDVLMVACCIALCWSGRRRAFSWVHHGWFLLGFAFLFFNIVSSVVPSLGFARLAVLCLGVLFVWCAAPYIRNIPILAVTALAGTAVALVAIGQFFSQEIFASTIAGIAAQSAAVLGTAVVETSTGRFLRSYGPFPHPNVLGGYLVVALLSAIAWYFSCYERFQPWWSRVGHTLPLARLWRETMVQRTAVEVALSVSTFIFILVGIAVSFSRAALVAAFLGLLMFLYAKYIENPLRAAVLGVKLSLMGGLVLLGFFSITQDIWMSRLTGSGRLEAQSLQDRTSQYKEAERLFMANPLIGVGIGNYVATLPQYFPGRAPYQYQPIHNAFLLFFVELGLFGAIFLATYIYWYRKIAVRYSRHPLGIALLVALVPLALLDHYLWSSHAGVLILITAALVIGSPKHSA